MFIYLGMYGWAEIHAYHGKCVDGYDNLYESVLSSPSIIWIVEIELKFSSLVASTFIQLTGPFQAKLEIFILITLRLYSVNHE